MVTQDELKSKLNYNPETGIFTWLPRPKSFRANPVAGCLTRNGYVLIGLNKKHYLAHRLAFLYMNGCLPDNQVDHINRRRSDNKWNNLRLVTPSENNQNRTTKRELPIGVYEITRKTRKGIWYTASIQVGYKKYSSTFRKLDSAIEWRKNKEHELFIKKV